MKKSHQIAICSWLILVCFVAINCSKNPANASPQPTQITPITPVKSDVAMWLTNGDRSALLQKQTTALTFSKTTNSNPTIIVDTTSTYQTIDGFGFCLTGGSASLINALPAADQNTLLRELFLSDSTHIGISYIRISIGASDLSADDFTYDDVTSGTDVSLSRFSIDREKTILYLC